MAKKETTKKSTKKVSTKKTTTKKTKVVEELNIMETPVEETNVVEENHVDIEQMHENDKELKEQVLKHVASEILAEKNNSLEEYMSIPKEEMLDKAKEKIEDIKKINNQKVNDRIDHLFGYIWNGQEMDY